MPGQSWNQVRRLVTRALLLCSVLSAFPAFYALSAQTDPRLVDVIRDAQEGQGDSARIKVQRLLATTPPGDTLYPQILYTQAMVATDAAEMRRQLQRVDGEGIKGPQRCTTFDAVALLQLPEELIAVSLP